MSGRHSYSRPTPRTWWLKRSGYRQYMVREATSIFVLIFSIELYLALLSLVKGEQAWNSFLSGLQSPALIVLNWAVFAATLWHLITWIQLTPKTMPTKIAGKSISSNLIILFHYTALALFSVVILLIIGGLL